MEKKTKPGFSAWLKKYDFNTWLLHYDIKEWSKRADKRMSAGMRKSFLSQLNLHKGET